MIASETNKPWWKHSCLAKWYLYWDIVHKKHYSFLHRPFLSPVLLAWLGKKCLFHLISHCTLSLSVLRRKFPSCVAPSWCYFQGMACRLLQIGDPDCFFCLQSGLPGREVEMQLSRGGLAVSQMGYICTGSTCLLGGRDEYEKNPGGICGFCPDLLHINLVHSCSEQRCLREVKGQKHNCEAGGALGTSYGDSD